MRWDDMGWEERADTGRAIGGQHIREGRPMPPFDHDALAREHLSRVRASDTGLSEAQHGSADPTLARKSDGPLHGSAERDRLLESADRIAVLAGYDPHDPDEDYGRFKLAVIGVLEEWEART